MRKHAGSGVLSARPWLRRLAIGVGGAVVLLGILYFVVTSSAFLKALVLPRASRALQAQVTAGEIVLSPFSQLQLRQLKVEVPSQPPLLQADEVTVRYNLFALIGGRVAIREIRVVAPQINVIRQANGRSSLDVFLAGPKSPPKPRGVEPTQVDVGTVTVTQGSLRFTQLGKDGGSQTTEISHLDLALERVKNAGTGHVKLSAEISEEQKATNQTGRLQARLNGAFDFALDKALQPQVVNGNLKLAVTAAEGLFHDLGGLDATVTCDLTTNQLRQLALRVDRQGQPSGQIRVSGPLNQNTREGRLNLEMTGIDRNLLNLAGAGAGLDFADTRLEGSAQLDLARGGQFINASGQLTAARFSFRRAGQTIPTLDLALDYQTTVNLTENTAIIERFSLSAKQGQSDLLRVSLDKALSLAWGQVKRSLTESNVRIALTNLDLADWQSFTGTNVVAGRLSATSDVLCQSDGHQLTGSLKGSLTNLTVRFGSFALDRAAVAIDAPWSFTDFHAVRADNYTAQLAENGNVLLAANGSASYDLGSHAASLQLNAEAGLPGLVRQLALPGLEAARGRVNLNLVTSMGDGRIGATITAILDDFSGKYPPYQFQNYRLRFEAGCDMVGRAVTVRRLSFAGSQGTNSPGSVDFVGKYDPPKAVGDFTLNINNLSQGTLDPFLAPFLAPLSLASVSVTGSGSLHYEPAAKSSIQLQAEVQRFQVVNAQKRAAAEPMSFKLRLQAAQQGTRFDLPVVELDLPPTKLATNVVTLQGNFDFAATNPQPGQLSLKASALDLTSFYDLFATNRPPTAAMTNTLAKTGGWPETEPAPIHLPLQQFTANATVDRLFLRQIAISNWVATLRLSNDVMTLQPFTLTLNGVPVNADLKADLRQPGYSYALNLKTENLPLAPLASLGSPDSRTRLQGNVTAIATLQGIGITGPSLQKNLSGEFNVGSTNLNLSIATLKSPVLKSIVNTIVGIPDLIRNPTGALGNLLGGLVPGSGSTNAAGGWVDQLTASPIDTITVQGKAGSGRLDVQQALVQNQAFRATATGAVTLAPVLTNSTLSFPVAVWLAKSMAAKIGVTSTDTSAGTNYVKLPDFFTLQGTVGAPNNKINRTGLLSLAAKAGAGLFKNTGNATVDRAVQALDALGSLRGAKSSATNAPATTNVPANSNPVDLLNRLLPRK
ncbi:MAG: AsmA family protein [Verrucomicrobiota bacterium]